MSLRKPASERALSIVEVLLAGGIAALSLTLIASLCKPMMSAQNAESASMQQIETIDAALYHLQRDIRQSDPNGIFICANHSGSVTCSLASNASAVEDAPILAVLTAQQNGTGPTRWDSTGRPVWLGFNVYWLATDANGVNELLYGFGAANIDLGQNPAVLNADAAAAVAQAIASTSPQTVARDVQDVQSMVDVTHDRVAIRVVGRSTSGASSAEIAVQGDAYARN